MPHTKPPSKSARKLEAWQAHAKAVEGLDVLARCKALNDFLRQGLLDREADGSTAVSCSTTSSSNKGTGSHAPKTAAPQHKCAAPLATRITDGESLALLELLDCDDMMAGGDSSSSTAVGEGGAAGCAAQQADGAPAAAVPPAQTAACDAQRVASAAGAADCDDDGLADVIGLLNPPQPPDVLRRPSPPAAQRALSAASRRPACREEHRQSWAVPAQQHQPGLLEAARRVSTISEVWQGYYEYWGPHAAATIQHAWRGFRARQRFLQERAAATALQACVRGTQVRQREANPLRRHRQEQRQLQATAEQEAAQRLQEQAALMLQCCVRRQLACVAPQQLRQRQQQQQQLQDAVCAVAVDACTSASSCGSDAVAPASSAASASTDGASMVLWQQHGGSSSCSSSGSVVSSRCCSREAGSCCEASEQQPPQQDSCVSEAQQRVKPAPHRVPAYTLPDLVVRCAADARTASGGDDLTGAACQERLARELCARAAVLQRRESAKQAGLASRTLLVKASGQRELSVAMQVVKGGS